jgi:hypothetical protein
MAQIKEVYRSSMTEDEMIGKATVSVLTGVPTKLGEYVVRAGEMVSVGYGKQSGLHDATGRFFAKLLNAASVELRGKLRLSVYSPQDRPMMILAEYDTDIVNDNETDRTKQTPFPENAAWISEDKKLVLEFIAKADGTVDKSKSKVLFDVTQAVI